MTTQQIQYFLEAASCLSFSEVARRLFVTQSAVSKQIASLEAELGLQLFSRNNRMLSLTSSGEYLHREMALLNTSLDRIVNRAQQLKRDDEGRLVCSILDLTDYEKIIFPMLRSFHAAYPKISLELSFCGFRELKERLEMGHTDVAFNLFLEMSSIADVDHTPLYFSPPSALLSASHPLAGESTIALEQLKDIPFIMLENKEGYGQTRGIIERCAEVGFHPDIGHYAANCASMLYYINEGYGTSIVNGSISMPTWCNIVCIPLSNSCVYRENHMVLAWPKKLSGESANRNPSVRVFQKFAEEYIQGGSL